MKYLTLCLTAVALTITSAATALSPATEQATPVKPKKEKRVCRERMRSGSHLSNIVCKTPGEWARLQAEFDDQDDYGIPGGKVTTGRELSRSPTIGGVKGE
jgi:hypothetical protein